MQNVRFPDRLMGFVEAIVFALRGLFVTDRSRNHSVAQADRPKLLNDCVHPLLKMPLQIAKALSTPKTSQEIEKPEAGMLENIVSKFQNSSST